MPSDDAALAADDYADARYPIQGYSHGVAREAFLAGVSWGELQHIESEVIG